MYVLNNSKIILRFVCYLIRRYYVCCDDFVAILEKILLMNNFFLPCVINLKNIFMFKH